MSEQNDLVKLKVEGMTCTGCAATIEKYLKKNNLKEVRVDFVEGLVQYIPELNTSVETISEGINKLGYRVISHTGDKKKLSLSLVNQLIISGIFTLPLILHHVFPGALKFLHPPYIQFLLSLPAVVIGLNRFLPGAWKSVWSGSPNMDVTICLGAIAAFIYSIIGWVSVRPEMIFFETAASILTLVLLGNYIEHKGVKKTSSSIDDLQKIAVEYGKMQMPSGAVVKIPLMEIGKGDLLIVAEGDAIPLDGVIVAGSGLVDESWISGESVPINKSIKDKVIGASQLISGNFTMKVESVSNETVLSKIIDMVKKASFQKAPIQRLADKISAIFVPTVLIISVLTFLANYFFISIDLSNSLLRAIAVLVISCPCAMGLATPTAIMAGLGKAMREGILIKGAGTLETLGKTKNIILDKTGTLTHPEIEISYQAAEDEIEIAGMVYAMESKSSHPIAQALIKKLSGFKNPLLLTSHVSEAKGKGLTAVDPNGNRWSIGWSEDTPGIQVSKNDELVAIMKLTDSIKPDAQSFVTQMNHYGITPFLLSGDAQDKVKSVADRLGIQHWQGRLMPDQKVAEIKPIQSSGPTVMVGDGINDGPALSTADVGVSFSQASQVAIQSSQVILLNDKLSTLSKSISVGRQTLSTIKQNLFWAFSYNIVAIPLAAAGYLNPMWGALFMAFSDLVVIGNSLRLMWSRIK